MHPGPCCCCSLAGLETLSIHCQARTTEFAFFSESVRFPGLEWFLYRTNRNAAAPIGDVVPMNEGEASVRLRLAAPNQGMHARPTAFCSVNLPLSAIRMIAAAATSMVAPVRLWHPHNPAPGRNPRHASAALAADRHRCKAASTGRSRQTTLPSGMSTD